MCVPAWPRGCACRGCRSVPLAARGLGPPLTSSLSPTHTLIISTGHVEIRSQSASPRRVLNVVIYKHINHSPKEPLRSSLVMMNSLVRSTLVSRSGCSEAPLGHWFGLLRKPMAAGSTGMSSKRTRGAEVGKGETRSSSLRSLGPSPAATCDSFRSHRRRHWLGPAWQSDASTWVCAQASPSGHTGSQRLQTPARLAG